MGRKGRPSLSCHPEKRSDEGPLSASRDFVGSVPMKGSLASLGMTNGTRGRPSLSCHPEERSDEGPLSAPRDFVGSVPMKGVPRFARDDKWDERAALTFLSSREAKRRGTPFSVSRLRRQRADERGPSLRSG